MRDAIRPYRPTAKEIQRTAHAVIKVLAEHNFNCCLFGSTAAAMYDARNRNPRDVDVIVLVPPAEDAAAAGVTVEDIKLLIADNASSDFYLVDSKDPTATHKIMYFILTPSHPDPSQPLHRACKVDLLLPGMIGIPKFIPLDSLHRESYFPEIPLVPFAVLLLLKLRAWAEHRVDERRRMREKLKIDESDLAELLDLAVNEYMIRLKDVERWTGWEWVEEMKEYVFKYVERTPSSKAMWEEIGFVLKSEWSLPPRRLHD